MNIDLEELKEEAKNRVQEIENEIRIKLTPDEYLSYLIESNKTGIFSELIDKIKSNSININDKEQEKIAYNNLLNVINKKKNCPFCNSEDTIPYYYGVLYPDMIEQTNYGTYDSIMYINYCSSRGIASANSARAAAQSYSGGGGGFSSGGGGGGSFGGGGGGRRVPLKTKCRKKSMKNLTKIDKNIDKLCISFYTLIVN